MSVPADTTATTVPSSKISTSLQRYRIAAYVVGCGLIALCVAMVFKYGFDAGTAVAIIGPLHGFLYMIYIALTVDLALKARWSAKGAVGVLLAGTIPFVSFLVERGVTRRVKAGRSL